VISMNMQNKETLKKEEILKRQYVTFSIGEEKFGIDVIRAQEVLNLTTITKMPNTMKFMKGVIDLRGRIIPLIDMRLKFNIDECPYDKSTVIIIARIRGVMLGLIVDSVLDVISMTLEDIQDTPHFASEVGRDAVAGVGRTPKGLVIVLDADRLFTDEEISTMQGK